MVREQHFLSVLFTINTNKMKENKMSLRGKVSITESDQGCKIVIFESTLIISEASFIF
jgi:hypothetical protein